MKDFAKLCKQVHQTAVEKGWWKKPPSTETIICLIHTEISEAFEEYRRYGLNPEKFLFYGIGNSKPEGIAVELADVVIRLMNWCEHDGVELEWVLGYPEIPEFALCMLGLHDICVSLGNGRDHPQTLLHHVIGVCGVFNIPLEQAIREKMAYDETRPFKHGGLEC